MPKAPKPVYATVQELESAVKELETTIESLKPVLATKFELQGGLKQLEGELKDLTCEVEKNAETSAEAIDRVATDARNHTDATSKNDMEETQRMVSMARTDLTLVDDSLDDRITATDKAIREDFRQKMSDFSDKVDNDLNNLDNNLKELIELRHQQALDRMSQHRQELDDAIEALRKEADDDNTLLRKETAQDFADLRTEQSSTGADKDQANALQFNDVRSRADKLAATAEANRKTAEEETAKARRELMAKLTHYADVTDAHIADLDEECNRINDNSARLFGIGTRRVEWSIKNAATLCRAPRSDSGKPYSSWFSPKFHAAGGVDFQLELRVYAPDDSLPPSSPSGDSVLPSNNDGVGNCAVFIWGCQGVSAGVRLIIGSRSAVIEKDFQVRMAHGTRRLGFVEDHFREDDSLLLGAEFIEVIRKSPAELPKPIAKMYGDRPILPTSGTLDLLANVNHRAIPVIRKEIERLQARLVRRVEWMLEQASTLPDLFKPVEPICSPVFGAAGVEGLQLIFYPNGYSGATEGFCSLFLFCPAGVTMKYRLIIGKQIRDCTHEFTYPGAYGRTNYCRFDGLADPQEDTICVTMEIQEVTQEVHAQIGSDETKIGGEKGEEKHPAVDTVVKLKRIPGKESLVDIKPLPTLWTAKALGDITAPPDGFHTWADLSSVRGARAKDTGQSRNRSESPQGRDATAVAKSTPKALMSATGGFGNTKFHLDFAAGTPKGKMMGQLTTGHPAVMLDVARGPASPMLSKTATSWPKRYESMPKLPPSPGRGPRTIPETRTVHCSRSASRG